MAKGKGTGKSSYFWRNKIKNERKSPKFRFRGRVRSKGESKMRSTSAPPQKGQKWTNKIKRERTPIAKFKTKKITPKPARSSINRSKVKPSVMPRQKVLVKSTQAQQPRKTGNYLPQNNRIKQPIITKKALNLLKSRQAVVKAPEQGSPSKNLKPGISKLKNAVLKNQPVKAPAKAKVTPSKGASMLKKNATRIGNQPRPTKRVQPPVIRRGR